MNKIYKSLNKEIFKKKEQVKKPSLSARIKEKKEILNKNNELAKKQKTMSKQNNLRL